MTIHDATHPIWTMVKGSKRRPTWLGHVLIALGWTLIVAGGLLFFAGKTSTARHTLGISGVTWLFACTIGFVGGQGVRALGAKMRQKSGKAALLDDARRPVLYLRAFGDDSLTGMVVVNSPNRMGETAEFLSEEELVLQGFAALGPVVAIGLPGELLPKAGASRLYVADENWKFVVDAIAIESALVVLRLGSTPGLVWELMRTDEYIQHADILVLVPQNVPEAAYRQLAEIHGLEAIHDILPHGESIRTLRGGILLRRGQPVRAFGMDQILRLPGMLAQGIEMPAGGAENAPSSQ